MSATGTPERIERPDGTVLELIETRPIDVPTDGRRPARRKARKQALDVLYAAELRGSGVVTVWADLAADADVTIRPFAHELVDGVESGRAEYRTLIERHLAAGWTWSRLPALDRCLALIGVHELIAGSTDASVVIAELVRFAQEYSTDDSSAFLNGLLASVLQDVTSARVDG